MIDLERDRRIKQGVKDCPWCPVDEKQWRRLYYTKASDGSIAVACWNCGAIGPSGSDKHDARKEWNDRQEIL